MIGDSNSVRHAIDNARALIDAMAAHGWREVHFRSGDTEIFVAHEGGGPNSMRIRTSQGGTVNTVVSAPHVGTIVECVALGTVVAQGACVAMLRVLDTRVEVSAPVSGRVAAIHGEVGTLVGFGAPIMALAQVD
jgi:biotin carboxyl carrier protein